MPNGTYGGERGRKTKVGRKLLRFPPTRLWKRYIMLILCIVDIVGIKKNIKESYKSNDFEIF